MKEDYDVLLTVLNALDAIVYVSDIKTNELLFVNNYVKNIFGNIIGQTCWKVLQTGQSGPCTFCTNDKLLDSDGNPVGTYHWEFQNTTNGRWYDIRDRALRWTDGRMVRIEIAIDITGRKNSEEKLHWLNDLMKYVISHANAAIAVHDRDMKYIYVSDSYLKQYQVNEKDVIGKHHYEVFPDLPQKWRDVHLRVLAGAVESGEMDPYVHEDGSVDWTRWTCRPWYESDGSIGGLIVYTEVITEQVIRERALRDKEKLLSETQRIAHIGSLTVSLDWKHIQLSQESYRIFGVDPNNFVPTQQNIFSLVHKNDLAVMEKWFRDCMVGQNPPELEFCAVRPDGTERFISSRAYMDSSRADSQPYLVCSIQDITERKKVEEKLQESEERFRLAMLGASDGLWDWDLLTDEVYYSPRWKAMLGYAEDELEDHLDTWKKVVHPDDLEPSLLFIKNFLEGKEEKYELEFRLRHKEGPYLHILSRATLVRGSDGKPSRLVGTHVDITERKQAEAALMESEYRLKSLINGIPDAVFFKDVAGRHIVVNKANETMFGLTPDMMLGKMVEDILPADIAAACRKHEENALKTNTIVRLEEHMLDNNGNEQIFDSIKVPLYYDSGNPMGLVGIIRDITERKRAEEELSEYRRHLEYLVRERTEELEKQKEALEQKNIALREIVGQIELEKNKIKENILGNIEELIIPILKKSKTKNFGEKHIDLIEQNLKKITSSFGITLSSKKLKLTPREIDICNLVEKGLTNKEMSDLLNISTQSIEGYRKNIRKKLGLSKKSVNLTTYLRSFR